MKKKNKSIEKKLSSFEERHSFTFQAPVSGSLGPLDLSRDPILRKGECGIGFVLDDFTEKSISSPVTGKIVSIIDGGTGFIVLQEDTNIHLFVKFSGALTHLYGRGFVPIVREGKKVLSGKKIINIDRELLEEKLCNFQVTVTFYRTDEEKDRTETKYDILYSAPTSSDNGFEKGEDIGTTYLVRDKDSIEYRKR